MICYDNSEHRDALCAIAQAIASQLQTRTDLSCEIAAGESSDRHLWLAVDPARAQAAYTIRIAPDRARTIALIGGSVRAVAYAAHRLFSEVLTDRIALTAQVIDGEMIRLRDPCVLLADGRYYVCESNGHGYSVRKSDDLYAWSDPVVVFDADSCTDPRFDGFDNFWAPELHAYNGKYYIFATYRSRATDHRGVAIFRGDTPDSSFTMISDGHVTPKDWDAIDGTLYIDDDGTPWMVFVHEWTSMPDKVGNMSAVRLTADLTAAVGEITVLFSAADAPFAPQNNVTDGPYLYRFASGRLAMLWSGFDDRSHNGYFTAVAYSDSGILGPWMQAEQPLYMRDPHTPGCLYEGGHGMLFTDRTGRLRLSLHSPNGDFEAMTFLDVANDGETLAFR